MGSKGKKGPRCVIFLMYKIFILFLLPSSQRRPTKANEGQRRPMKAHSSQRRPTKDNAGPRRPTAANDGQQRPMAANQGQRRPTAANAGPQKPMAANEGQRRPTKAHGSQRRPTTAHSSQRRPTTAHSSQRRPTKAHSSQRRPTQAHKSPRQPMKANDGPQQPTQANDGPQQPTQANESPQKHTQANAGPRKPTAANEGQRQPTAANAGPRRPTAANDGQRRPTQAHEDKKGPNDARWRRLGPRYVFFFIFFILFLLLRDSGHPTRTRTPRNPYPGTRVRVFWGTGTGSPGKPQGYPCQALCKITGYSDADWASHLHRHSISGFVYFIGGGIVSWSSKKQPIVNLSSTEAEYVALTHSSKDILWIHKFLSELSTIFSFDLPTTLFCDNQGAIRLSKDSTFHARTKHIDIHFHFIRQTVSSGNVSLKYCPTSDMIADIFTKSLAHVKFAKF